MILTSMSHEVYWTIFTIVGRTPWSIAPQMLKTSPASHIIMNCRDNPSAYQISAHCPQSIASNNPIGLQAEPQWPYMKVLTEPRLQFSII